MSMQAHGGMSGSAESSEQDRDVRLAALEAEVARLRDHQEVCRVIASYGPLVDTTSTAQRAAQLACLWHEDGIYDIGAVGAMQGREAIAEVFAQRHFDMVPSGVCHVMGLPHVRIDGDRAVALNYSCVFRPEGEERFYAWRVSANRWELRRVAGIWRIDRRSNRLMNGDPDARALLDDIDGPIATETGGQE
jgi:hypothetical protein